MATIFTHTREAVRVKVKKCELNSATEWRKFSVDPQITTLEVLYSLLAKAFDIRSDFSIKYKAYDPAGNEIYLPVHSDWDLDAAFLRIHNVAVQTSTEACLMLQIDIKPFTAVREYPTDGTGQQDAGTTPVSQAVVLSPTFANASSARELISPLQQSLGVSQKYVSHMQAKLPGLIMNQMEKTFSIVQKAFNLSEETMASLPPRVPLSDSEFRMFLDALGNVQRNEELQKAIFFGGIEPSLRRVVWKHILNVYPIGLNGHQRMDYMRRKSERYHQLRDTWKRAVQQGSVSGELAYVTGMVKKDVLRTDRLHGFYAGSDDNQNIASLFNILTTYALNHPSVSYCQGMSDIASPLLVTMNDEAQAYICFCAIMSRMRGNFMLDGVAMTQKFAHLTVALGYYDPEFWEYLKLQQADDLLFCYRWLLLELKREFPFEDALRMLEVQWSSLRYEKNAANNDLRLFEEEFLPAAEGSAETPPNASTGPSPASPSFHRVTPRETPYSKVCDLRRQGSSASLSSLSGASLGGHTLDASKRLNHSVDENMARYAMRRQRRATAKAHQSLDEAKMLSLMEGIETGRGDEPTASVSSSHTGSETVEDLDDEVFTSAENDSSALTQFDFHPTNPFKDDAPWGVTDTQPPAPVEESAATKDGDSDVGFLHFKTPQIPQSIAKLHNKNILSNYGAVSEIIAKRAGVVAGGGGSHFKDLKEKLAATTKRGMSFEDFANSSEKSQQQKLVKNFNEFLNFAALNKSRIADKFATPTLSSVVGNNPSNCPEKELTANSPSPTHPAPPPHPLVQLTRSSFGSSVDSDSSSVPDTTWSGSTAATAIQQGNNLSSGSLCLEANSLSSSANHTPLQDRTPTFERKVYDMKTAATPLEDYASGEQDYVPITTDVTRELRREAEQLERQIFGFEAPLNRKPRTAEDGEISYEKLEKMDSVELTTGEDVQRTVLQNRCSRTDKPTEGDTLVGRTALGKLPLAASLDAYKLNPFIDTDSLLLEDGDPLHSLTGVFPNSCSLPEVLVPISTDAPPPNASQDIEMATNAGEDEVFGFSKSPQHRPTSSLNGFDATAAPSPTTGGGAVGAPLLPPPTEFGGGNPFLMFLCLTLLLQHRNTIIKSGMDYNEIAMHFDKMVRKHDVTRVLNQARRMYIEYLKAQRQVGVQGGTGNAAATYSADASRRASGAEAQTT